MPIPGACCDPASPPGEIDLRAVLGPSWPRWRRLIEWVDGQYGLAGEPVFTGRASGWAVRFRRSGKTLLTMSPQAAGGFRALIVIGPSVWDAVPTIGLGPVAQQAWDSARAYPDGRWLFVQVDDDRTVEDIERLVALKPPPPRRRRNPSAITPTDQRRDAM